MNSSMTTGVTYMAVTLSQLIFAKNLYCFIPRHVAYITIAFEEMFPMHTNTNAMIPSVTPPRGIIHVVGSLPPITYAAAVPRRTAMTSRVPTPIQFAHIAPRAVVVVLVSDPRLAHHESPAPTLSSIASTIFTVSLS